jgi:signal transduction histidine kinase
MKERDEVQRLEERVEALEQELRVAKSVAWLGLAASYGHHATVNTVQNINAMVELIRVSQAGGLSERAEKLLGNIEAAVSSVMDLQIGPPSSSDAMSINVGDFLADYTNDLHQRMVGKGLDVRLESSTEAHARVDPTWLRRSVDLIVENAGEAMRHSPEKVLTLGAAAAGDRVEIRIADTGPGVPVALRPQLFRVPVKGGERKGQLGFGLLIARTIVQTFGGDVRLDEGRRDGATFIISLPKEAHDDRQTAGTADR